jgi:hypothetical protein
MRHLPLALLCCTVPLAAPVTAQELILPIEEPASPTKPAFSLGGYGELHLSSAADGDGGRAGEVDFHRFVLFFGHQYDENFRFYSELEMEHAYAGPGKPGAVELEQAFIEYGSQTLPFRVRAGLVLVPFGHLNTIHEPTAFHGVERPKVDNLIIPSTWREAGLGVVGTIGETAGYEAYLISGLNAAAFSAEKGLRGGRTAVAEAYAGAPAVVARLHAKPVIGLEVALSGYHGDAGANHPTKKLEVGVTGGAFDLRYKAHAIEARAEVAAFSLSGSEALATPATAAVPATATTPAIPAKPASVVGSLITGGYLELGVDLLELAGQSHELVPFVRYEQYDTTAEVAEGAADPKTAGTDLVFGLTWRPIPQIALKLDHIVRTPEAGSEEQVTSAGLGYMF